MTTLVLGTAGALVGGAFGGSIGAQVGWLVGSMLGNLIDPPKIEGPRRTDLKLQISEYGKPIPIVWGLGRLAGNVIDQTDLQEHKETSGGKGGPEVTKYTYSASFAILLCEGPIKGVQRIWADGRLIWSKNDGTDMPCTLYLGDEDQDPDPTFEAIHGVGAVPAYRGMAYVVFADYTLTDFGDRIPMLEFEVYTEEGTIPWRVLEFTSWTSPGLGNFVLSTGIVNEGVIITIEQTNDPGSCDLIAKRFNYDGEQVGETITQNTSQPVSAVVYNSGVCQTFENFSGGGGQDVYWWRFLPEENAFRMVSSFQIFSHGVGYYMERMALVGDTIIALGHQATDTVLYTIPYNSGTPGELNYGTSYILSNKYPSDLQILGSNEGDGNSYFYLIHTQTGLSAGVRMWKFDMALNLLHFWDVSDTAGTWLSSEHRNSYVWNNLICVHTNEGAIGGGANIYRVRLVKINADYSLEDYGGYISRVNSPSIFVGNGLMLDAAGIYSLIPPPADVTLASIVSDISDMTDIDGAYDVSELTDTVHWFAMTNQMTARNAIETLRRGFMFDAVESDDTVKFRKRGATDSVVTIDDDDLAARDYGQEQQELLQTVRKKEKGMPRTVTLRYIDIDTDYATGAQSSPRLTTLSDQDTTLDLAIGFTASEALQKSWALQVSEWIERETFTWETNRKYAWVEPCDVVTVRGRVVRVSNRTDTPTGVIQWEGVLHRPSIYTQEQTSSAGSGENTQTQVPNPPFNGVGTQLVLLDIPLISFSDYVYGFYAAAGPVIDGSWPGYTLYKSVDGGVTWTSVYSTSTPSIIGVTASTVGESPPVGSPDVDGVLSTYAGGDTVQEASIYVELTSADSELTSTNAAGLANGLNMCAISRGYAAGSPTSQQWEILQFRDVQQVDTRKYIISGFLRGRKGTLTSGHAVGDTFVMLPAGNVDAPQQELGVPLLYKAVTYGFAIADIYAVSFTNTGLGALSYFAQVTEETPVFTGETPGSPTVAPAPGMVPAPSPGDVAAYKFLFADGTWQPAAPPYASYLVRSASGILQNESVLQPGSRITFTDGGGSPPTSITVSANMQAILLNPAFSTTQTIDLTNYSNYHTVIVDITVTNNFTFNITNGFDGQLIRVRLKQDGTGGWVMTAGGNLRFSTDLPSPTLTTTANKIDRLAFEWHAADGKADLVAINKGF